MQVHFLLLPLLLLPMTSASCFGRDAHFKKKPPVVVQPNRADPTKILVSWEQSVERPQCVDRYWVRVWPEGTEMALGGRHLVNETDPAKKQVVLTKTVTIEPCVNYRIAVELEELDKVSGKDLEKTTEANFRSTATPSIPKTLTSDMAHTSYLWDPVRKVVDLTKAVVSLRALAVTYPNCLDYLQLTGAEVLATGGPRLSSVSRSASTRGRSNNHISKRCQEESTAYRGASRPEVIPGVESWPACSRQCSAKPSCKAWTWGRRSARPGTGLQCTTMQGFTGRTPDSHMVSGPRDCQPSQASPAISAGVASTLPARTPARPSYSSVTGGSARPSSLPRSSASPSFSNLLPRTRSGAARMVGPIKLNPPYLKQTIDLTVPVEDCAGYMFHLQIYGGSKKIGELASISLPALANLPGFVPAPVTSVVAVSYSTSGVPIYKVNPESGVPLSCLPAYFEAYDAYAQRVDNEVSWVEEEEKRVEELAKTSSGTLLTAAQDEILKAHGCTCSSPSLKLSTTDANVLKKEKAVSQIGSYALAGMHKGHPFYKKTPNTPTSASTTTSGTSSAPAPARQEDPVFLYYIPSKQQWVFGSSLASTSGLFFASAEKSAAKCPGDSNSRGGWQTATGTFGRWKANSKVSVECETKI